jgi:hypothetical protein
VRQELHFEMVFTENIEIKVTRPGPICTDLKTESSDDTKKMHADIFVESIPEQQTFKFFEF